MSWPVGLLIGLLLSSALVWAARRVRAEPVPQELRAALMLRVLAYDQNLDDRVASNTLTVLVLAGANADDAAEFERTLREFEDEVTVGGYRLRVISHAFTSFEELETVLRSEPIHVIYVGAGLEGDVSTLSRVTEDRRIILVAADAAAMPNGCAIGFALRGGRPVIRLDLARLRAIGVDLHDTVLGSAELL